MKNPTRRTNRIRNRVLVTIVALLSLAMLLAVVPLWEGRSEYCLYCGREAVVIRCVGVPIRKGGETRNAYNDGVVIPPHEHRMIVSNRSRLWAYRGQEFLDEFGWTGRGYREALVSGITAHPERKGEIIAEFLKIDPAGEAGKEFIKSYAAKK